MTVVMLDMLDSFKTDSEHWLYCDVCSESSLADLCGAEVRPFYAMHEQGEPEPYTVCVECVRSLAEVVEETA